MYAIGNKSGVVVEAFTPTKCDFIFWFAETMWCLSWFCCWFSSFLENQQFQNPITPGKYGRYKEQHWLFMLIWYHQNHYFIYLFVIYLLISSCHSSYPSGVAVAQRLAPFGVARFLYADVEKKPENGEPISIYKAAVSIVSDFKWNTLPSPVDIFLVSFNLQVPLYPSHGVFQVCFTVPWGR